MHGGDDIVRHSLKSEGGDKELHENRMLAGWDAEQMLGAVDGVAQLAIASGEDLGAVADIVTN